VGQREKKAVLQNRTFYFGGNSMVSFVFRVMAQSNWLIVGEKKKKGE
jgi:hypothetical protein